MTRDKELFSKYPKIFSQVGGSAQETCMFWGCECGDGWFDLLDNLCAAIQARCDTVADCPQLVAEQIKEKFGGLRFYYYGGDEEVERLISEAEDKSEETCERCGQAGTLRGGGWIYCACDKCDPKNKAVFNKEKP